MLPFMPVMISSRLGFAFFVNKALADMIMPEV
jgi:hypothetical protein